METDQSNLLFEAAIESPSQSEIRSHLNEVDLIGKLADLKDEHYRNSLMLSTLIDLLSEKGIFSRQEFADKAAKLDKKLI